MAHKACTALSRTCAQIGAIWLGESGSRDKGLNCVEFVFGCLASGVSHRFRYAGCLRGPGIFLLSRLLWCIVKAVRFHVGCALAPKALCKCCVSVKVSSRFCSGADWKAFTSYYLLTTTLSVNEEALQD